MLFLQRCPDLSWLIKVWKFWAPSKVIVFSWQLLQNRIPSYQNLFRRRVITDINNTLCALCGNSVELMGHLFLTYEVSSTVWHAIFRWLRFQCVLPRGVIGLFEFQLGMSTVRRAHLRWLSIWHAVIWSIWNSPNNLIFTGGSSSVEYQVDKVKLFTWKWYLVKNPANPCSLYELKMQPIFAGAVTLESCGVVILESGGLGRLWACFLPSFRDFRSSLFLAVWWFEMSPMNGQKKNNSSERLRCFWWWFGILVTKGKDTCKNVNIRTLKLVFEWDTKN
jgi:hypothetical protein